LAIQITSRALAAHVGLSQRRISQLVKQGLPKKGRNKFDLDVACKWIHAHEREQLAKLADTKQHESLYWHENARLIRLKANKEEDEERVRRRQLIEVPKLKPWLDRIVGSFKEGALGMRARLEPALGPEHAQIVEAEIKRQLNLLAKQTKQGPAS
jgi:phage terminase Nu1 subunit (DNA packaging protein)